MSIALDVFESMLRRRRYEAGVWIEGQPPHTPDVDYWHGAFDAYDAALDQLIEAKAALALSAPSDELGIQFSRLKRAFPHSAVSIDMGMSFEDGADEVGVIASIKGLDGSRLYGGNLMAVSSQSIAEAVDALIEKLPAKVDQYAFRNSAVSLVRWRPR